MNIFTYGQVQIQACPGGYEGRKSNGLKLPTYL